MAPPQPGKARAQTIRGRRTDIQGLRAIAVVAVVLNHLTGHPIGGFVGVDVFFVISGYLISGMLMHDLGAEASPRRFLLSFYRRRVRRLLPAALVVTIVTIVAAYAVFPRARFDRTLSDAGWSTIFAANWHFMAVGTNYFAANQSPSPFQHYWSLSVEEQFYLVWPAVLLAVATVSAIFVRRTARTVGLATAVAAAAVFIGCLVAALHQTASSPVDAYFSTVARAWELALGALVAVAAKRIALGPRLASLGSCLGVIVIVLSFFTIRNNDGFPAPNALVPCLGTALALAAFSSKRQVVNPLLNNRLFQWIGNLSYSIYLVHYPVIVLLLSELPSRNTYFYTTSLALTVGFSCLLFYGIEKPVLDSRFLASDSHQVPARSSQPRRHLAAANRLGAALGAAIVALGFAVFTLWPGNAVAEESKQQSISASLAANPIATSVAQTGGTLGSALQGQLRAALRATTWPTLSPAPDQEVSRTEAPPDLNACGSITLQTAQRCTFGPTTAKHTMYLIGDSTAMSYAEVYRQIVSHGPNWKLRIAAAFGCNFNNAVIRNDDVSLVGGCARHNAAVIAEINRVNPALIVVTNTYSPRVPVSGSIPLTDAQWVQSLDGEMAKLAHPASVAVVEPAPLGPNLDQCYRPTGRPVDCVYPLSADHLHRAHAERTLAQSRHWTYVSTEAIFCDVASGYCPEFAQGVLIKHDGVHATYAYDTLIWPAAREAMRRAGLPL
jgi:peptidoglycan/LPS O-acetylase OafA/YrhL